MKDFGDSSFVLDIKINCDRNHGFVELISNAYLKLVFKGSTCRIARQVVCLSWMDIINLVSIRICIIMLKEVHVKWPYVSVVWSLMYGKVCTKPNLTSAFKVFNQYLLNPNLNNWVLIKKVTRYLQKIKIIMIVKMKWNPLLDILLHSIKTLSSH